jgi:hypothetical protein
MNKYAGRSDLTAAEWDDYVATKAGTAPPDPARAVPYTGQCDSCAYNEGHRCRLLSCGCAPKDWATKPHAFCPDGRWTNRPADREAKPRSTDTQPQP